MKSQYFKDAMKMALLAAVYFAAAKVGLSLAALHESVSLVWPATGIALAAILIGGYRFWPGIFTGALLANVLATHVGFATSLGIATGNTLEAVSGAYLLRRYIPFEPSLEHLRDVLGLLFFGALLGTAVSASIGVASLCLGGTASWSLSPALWWQWWLGDMIGALVVTPFLLTWSHPPQFTGRLLEAIEIAGLSVTLIIVSKFSFGSAHPHLYPIFPVLVWTALRFGPRGSSTATLTVSGIAVWEVVSGSLPFAGMKLDDALSFLQPFMAVVALTTLVLAAIMVERKKAEEDLKKANEELRQLS